MTKTGRRLIQAAKEMLAAVRGETSLGGISRDGKHFRVGDICREVSDEIVEGEIVGIWLPDQIEVKWSIGLVERRSIDHFTSVNGKWQCEAV